MENNLSYYKVFYEVAKYGNISKASKKLYISQPAVSKSISKLEESLNTPLFIRNSRGVSLTAEGELLFIQLKETFSTIDMIETQIKNRGKLEIGSLKIGASNTLCKHLLLPYIKAFVSENPHIDINIISQSVSHTSQMLAKGSLDLGIATLPLSHKGLDFIPITQIHDIFVTTPEYMENLQLREGMDEDIFQTGNIMLLDRENASRIYIDDILKQNHIFIRHILEATTMDLLIEFAKTGIGIACVIEEFVQEDIQKGNLIKVDIPIEIPQRTVGFAYLSSNMNKSLLKFLKYIKE